MDSVGEGEGGTIWEKKKKVYCRKETVKEETHNPQQEKHISKCQYANSFSEHLVYARDCSSYREYKGEQGWPCIDHHRTSDWLEIEKKKFQDLRQGTIKTLN